jgi:hypothetical protein
MPKQTTQELDSSNTLLFSSTFKNQEISKSFYEYLRETNLTNRWDFILASHVLNSHIEKSDYNQAVDHIKYIMKTFFTPETKPLNLISQHTKEIVSKMTNNWKNQSLIELKMLIDILQDLLVKDYQNIHFPEFLKTPVAQKLIKKHKKDKKIVVPKLSQIIEYENIDFELETFDPKDVEFCSQFTNENRQHWESIYVSSKVKCYRSNLNYFPNVSFIENLDNFVLEFVFDYSFEETVCALFYNYIEKDANVVYSKVIDYKENETALIEQHIRIQPRCPRYKRYLVSMHYDSGKLMVINKPVKIGNIEFLNKTKMEIFNPKTKTFDVETAIQDFIFQSIIISKMTQNKSKLTLQLNMDLGFGAWGIPKALIKWKSNEIHKEYQKHFDNLKSKKFQNLKESFSEMKDGMPVNPHGKLLCDMNIFQETPKNQESNHPKTETFVMSNILEIMKQEPSNDLIQKSVENIVLSTIASNISTFEIVEKEKILPQSNFQFKEKQDLQIKMIPEEMSSNFSSNFLDFSEIVNSTDFLSEKNVSNEMLHKLDSFDSFGSLNSFSEIDDLISMINKNEDEDLDFFEEF